MLPPMTDDLTDVQKDARRLVSANLKRIRGKQGLSQERFADLSGLHRTYISQVERKVANITVDTLALIAHALKVELAELFFRSTEDVGNMKAGRPTKSLTETAEERQQRKAK